MYEASSMKTIIVV